MLYVGATILGLYQSYVGGYILCWLFVHFLEVLLSRTFLMGKKKKRARGVFLLLLGLHGSTVCMVDMVGKGMETCRLFTQS
jgi:hypothetical protein